MDILIVGPGAMGCLLATRLHQANEDNITILDHNQERARLIARQGVTCESEKGQLTTRLRVISDPQLVDSAEVIFLCVKSYDLQKSIDFCKPLFQPGSLCVFMQNGMGHLSFSEATGSALPIFCTSTEGANVLGPGHVRHAGAGITYLGPTTRCSEQQQTLVKQLAKLLSDGGILSYYSENIHQRLWDKLFVNVGINGLTAIHDCPNGDLLEIPSAMNEMEALIDEAVAVAKSQAITVDNPLKTTMKVCQATAKNISSMLQDIRLGRKTEIDAINGAIVEMGNSQGIATPFNQSLVERVKALEPAGNQVRDNHP